MFFIMLSASHLGDEDPAVGLIRGAMLFTRCTIKPNTLSVPLLLSI